MNPEIPELEGLLRQTLQNASALLIAIFVLLMFILVVGAWASWKTRYRI